MTPTTYERLTALDTAFLHVEGPATPMHVGSLAIFEGAPFFDDRGRFRLDAVRARVAERLDRVPRFRRKLLTVPFGQGRPVWVDDPEFDVARHVDLVVLPQPGTREMLLDVCARLQMQRLDREHPLWSITFVGGLEDGSVALVERVHHSLVDGVSGVDVAAALLDLEPSPPVEEPGEWRAAPAPGPIPLLAASLWQRATDPVEVVRGARVALRVPRRVLANVGAVGAAVRDVLGEGLAPVTPLNVAVGRRRALLPVARPLAAVRAAAHAEGATVNDAVLAAVAGGVRDLLIARGEDPDEQSMRVLVPVSVRTDDEHLALGNRVAMVVAHLPISVATPAGRLRAVRDEMVALKAGRVALGSDLVLGSADHLPPGLVHLLSRAVHHQPVVNLAVTNIPGPSFPLYFMGARMLEAIPIIPLTGNLALGVAVLSYDGTLQVSLHADRDACPDAHLVAAGVAATLDALAGAAAPGSPSAVVQG